MKVTLTGSTGFIGSHIVTELQEHGHEVTALVRDDAQADRLAAIGATPAVVDLYDRPALTSKFSSADGAIHTASGNVCPVTAGDNWRSVRVCGQDGFRGSSAG